MKTAIFVVGMHRSGTSAFSGVLDSMGVPFGEDLMAASSDNPKGYFENNKVQMLNERILHESGFSWDDFNFSVDLLDKSSLTEFIRDAESVLKSEYIEYKNFAIKDPRLCLTFPIWESACVNLGITAKVILPYRNPLEVIDSLIIRNSFSREKSAMLWGVYFLYSEFYTRSYERLFVNFSDLLSDNRGLLEQLSKFTEVGQVELSVIDQFIEPKLKHHNYKEIRFNEGIPSFIKVCIEAVENNDFNTERFDEAMAEFLLQKNYFFDFQQHNLKKRIFEDRKRYKLLKDDFHVRLNTSVNELEEIRKAYFSTEEKVKELTSEVEHQDSLIQEKDNLLGLKAEELYGLSKEFNMNLNVVLTKLNKKEDELLNAQYIHKKEVTTLQLELEKLKSETKKIQELHKKEVTTLQSESEKLKSETKIIQELHKKEVTTLQSELEKLKSETKIIQELHKKEVTTLQSELEKLKSETKKIQGLHEKEMMELQSQRNTMEKVLEDNKVLLGQRVKELEELNDSMVKEVAHIQEVQQKKLVDVLNLVESMNRGSTNLIEYQMLYNKHLTGKIHKQILKSIINNSFFKMTERLFSRVPVEFINLFNSKEYLNVNDDVARAVANNDFSSALEHFIFHGFDEVYRGDRKIHLNIPFYSRGDNSSNEAECDASFIVFLETCYSTFTNSSSVIKIEEPSNETISFSADNVTSKLQELLPSVDIILPVYNALDDVKNCIESLYRNDSFEFNLIVIDDCSELETKEFLERESAFKGFKLLRNDENSRFTKSVNRGFNESKGDYVVLLNSDTIVTPRWIEKILRCFQSRKDIGIVGPLSNAASWQTVPKQKDPTSNDWLVNETPEGYSIDDMGLLIETISTRKYPIVPSVNGFCYAIKREVINAIGILDVEYFPTGYGEEDDFSIRAHNAGFKSAIVDDTYVFHAKSKSYTHEVRKVLTKGGRKSLDSKHGPERIKALINDWLQEAELPKIAKHIESYMHNATNNKKVVFTAVFGNYDHVREPEYVNDDWDYICFTDNLELKSDVYEVKYVNPIFENPTKNARLIKVMPHLFLIGYEYSLWIDGNIKLRGESIEELIAEKFEYSTAVHSHSVRNCVYEEGKACINGKKDCEVKVIAQLEEYRKSGFPENAGMVETAQIFRKHDTNSKTLNELWWAEIDTHTIRDQLAFNYVCWKNSINYSILEGSAWLDRYFQIYKHGGALKTYTKNIAVLLYIDEEQKAQTVIRDLVNKTKDQPFDLLVLHSFELTSILRAQLKEEYTVLNIDFIQGDSISANFLNQILPTLKYDYVCCLDGDLKIVNSDWLTSLANGIASINNVTIAAPLFLSNDYSICTSGLKIKFYDGKLNSIKSINKYVGDSYVHAVHSQCFIINLNEVKKAKLKSFNSLEETIAEYCLKQLLKQNRIKTISESQVMIADKKKLVPNLSSVESVYCNKGPASFNL